MTRIVDLPALTTITNSLVFIADDTADGNRSKKVTLAQLVALSAGPRGLPGAEGPTGPTGPSGPAGPGANQSLNTSSSVVFRGVSISSAEGITFSDGTVQTTAFRRSVQDLTSMSVGNVSLTVNDISAPILTANPPAAGRNLYLPNPGASSAGFVLIVRNRSAAHTFDLWGGLANLATVGTLSSVQVACDGYTWFII